MLEIHFTLALMSVSGFILRAGWSFTAPDMLQNKWVRVLPHVVDTLLLVFGVLLFLSLEDASDNTWLVAKLVALVVYIGAGVMTLRGTGLVKTTGLTVALLAVFYLFAVAFTRSAIPV